MPAPEADLALIEQAVRDAGVIARKFYQGSYRKWDKGTGQPVTECDLAIDKFLCERLCRARPDYGWLSEETEDDPQRLHAKFVWVVDPIDGTVAFLKGRPHFTICAAVVGSGRPLAGVVYNPITGECFGAISGMGATLNAKQIHVSNRRELENCRMLGPATTFDHPPASIAPTVPWPPMHVETRNSVAYRLALVACGAFDATVALSAKHDWDLAAGDLIVQEAGGRITTHAGETLRYNGETPVQPSVVAAGPALHAQLVARVRTVKLPAR
ncbi:MAG TPA: 3'(2'),5'-bisphosphate nucleotidase CysQ [Rhizomicrobium sp.]|nr:3'(2'),5'-bisphosphate nucleotidase CysQ [Rhizomicrobium sp.]